MALLYVLILVIVDIEVGCSLQWNQLNLPNSHIEPFFFRHRQFAEDCLHSDSCPYKGDSELLCSQNGRFCKAVNLFMDLRAVSTDTLKIGGRVLNDADMFLDGELGGKCIINETLQHSWTKYSSGDYINNMKSWYGQLIRFFTKKSFNFDEHCDEIIEIPTMVVRWGSNSGYNIYDHFVDFISLYLSQHVNGSFNTDIKIIMWYTRKEYVDNFKGVWPVFTKYDIESLRNYLGKRISGCEGSSLYNSFAQHLLHRLNVEETDYKILKALQAENGFDLKIANFTKAIPLVAQLKGEHPPLEIGMEYTNYNNYHLDVNETLRLIYKAVRYVENHELYERKMRKHQTRTEL
ncbi:hypothetical protein CAPTEDRAFT_215445 [Capitella teleta]|uniref:Uncharacterized protein n=1 Tax=Capitella teleta TaxID=283909 RepID=R7TZQ9_CAPTE|nr:hypothetical protein CAPTEDRAFT_215445 [Capitella teleta]|eukprot:ELT99117.1 hypothetical protein CAPTEDRAFT_215445 [Capitella teleta]